MHGRGGPGGFDREAMRQRVEAIRMVEAYWMALTFDVKVSNEKLLALRSDFQRVWNARKEAREQIKPGDRENREKALKAIEEANAKLDAALKAKLTDAEYKKMKEVVENMHRGPRGGWGRGPGRHGMGPGPGGPGPGGACGPPR